MNKLIVISGPSGVGKGTIVKSLLKTGGFSLSISCTTRAPRGDEVNGKDYYFITESEFEKRIAEGGFLEYSNHFGNYYGTPKKFVEERLKSENVILEIEVNGALNVKKVFPQALLIMILPPSISALRERLSGRGTEDKQKIAERLSRFDYELSKEDLYDYAVVNDEIDTTVKKIISIIKEV